MPMSDITTIGQQMQQMISTEIQRIQEMTSDQLQDIIDSANVSIDDFTSMLTAIDQQTGNDGKVTIPQLLEVLNNTACPQIYSLLLGWVQMSHELPALVITEVQTFLSTNIPIIISSIEQVIEEGVSDIREYTATLVDVYSDGLEKFRAEIFSDYKSMVFNGIGPNDDGAVSTDQLREYASQLSLTDEEIAQFISNADSDGNGEINYAQFASAMRGKYLAKSIMSAFFENVSDYVDMIRITSTEAFAAAEVDSALAEVNKQDALIEMGDVDVNVFRDSVENDGELSIDAALQQDSLVDIGDLDKIDMNVFADSIENDGMLSVDAALKQDGLIDMNVFTDSIENSGELSIDAALGEVNEEDGVDVNVNVIDNDGKLSIGSFDQGQTDLASLLDELPVKHVHHKHVNLELVVSGLVVLVAILIFVILCLVFGRCSFRSAVKYAKTLQTNDDEEDDTQSEDDELIA